MYYWHVLFYCGTHCSKWGAYIKQSLVWTRINYHNCNHYTVPTNQSKVTVMQSDDNQPKQDDESSLVEYANGSYIIIYN